MRPTLNSLRHRGVKPTVSSLTRDYVRLILIFLSHETYPLVGVRIYSQPLPAGPTFPLSVVDIVDKVRAHMKHIAARQRYRGYSSSPFSKTIGPDVFASISTPGRHGFNSFSGMRTGPTAGPYRHRTLFSVPSIGSKRFVHFHAPWTFSTRFFTFDSCDGM